MHISRTWREISRNCEFDEDGLPRRINPINSISFPESRYGKGTYDLNSTEILPFSGLILMSLDNFAE